MKKKELLNQIKLLEWKVETLWRLNNELAEIAEKLNRERNLEDLV